MKIKSFKLPFTKKSALLVCFFAIMFLFASFTKEDRYKVRAFKLKMMEKYIHHHDIEDKPSTDRLNKSVPISSDSASTSSLSSIGNKNIINNGNFTPIIPEVIHSKDIDQVFESEEKQGMIGEFSDDESDNPSDNFFTITIPEVKNQNVKAYLVYDLFGLESFHSVSRSINKNMAFGGNIILPGSNWSAQKEEISLSSLKGGKNSVMFTSSINGIKYKVKNVKIVFEKGLNSAGNISSLRSGNQLYIKGIQNALGSNPLMIDNKSLQSTNGEFESLIELTEENKAKGSITIKNTGGVQEYKIPDSKSSFKTLNENSYTPLVINISKENEYSETYENASVTVEKNSVESSAQIQVLKLRKKDYPAVSREIRNMTVSSSAYRLSIKTGVLTKKVKLSIPYDVKKLGARSAKEVKAFYFDYTSKKWKVDPTGKVDAEKKVVTVEGDGDTDYINGVISVPESSQLESFAPTSISGLKAADPTAGLQLMAVPSANQKGDANADYPIRVPGGLGGLQPSLSIGYSSGGGNGWMGDGWNINGLSSITVDTRWGVPVFDTKNGGTETELYSLDGEMLVYPNQYLPHRHNNVSENNTAITTAKQQRSDFTDPNNSQVKKFYLRKNHDFSLIERIGNSPGSYTWKVTSTDGTKKYYGGSPDSMLSGSGGISHWGLRMIEDVHGNTMEFTYFNEGGGGGQFYQIKKIAYGRNKDYTVNFIKETVITRKDISINAKQGFARSEPYLLKEIQVKYKTELVRTYKMDYIDGEFYKTLLKRIYIVPHNPCSTTLASKSEIRDIDDGSGGGGGPSGGILPTCNEITDSYTFDYYNDVKDSGGNVKIFGPDTTINFENDKVAYSGLVSAVTLKPSKINGNVSSETGLNVRPAFGLNFYTPSSDPYGHLMFGFPFGTSKAKARNAQQLVDFNGDGIQDMISRVPNTGLFLNTGILDGQGNLSFSGSQPIENYIGGDFSFTETTTNSRGWDMGAIVFSRSQISSTSNGTNTTYLTDANSDGLMDIVHDGQVWFNKYNSNSGKSEMTQHSEYTENMVVKAKAIQAPVKWCGDIGSEMTEPCPEDLEELTPQPITDVVKVWIAPKDGYVRFTDNVYFTQPGILYDPYPPAEKKMYYSVEMQSPNPNNGTTNVYSNTRIYLKEIIGTDPVQNIEINHYNDYYSQMQGLPLDPNYGIPNGVNSPNRLFVKSGDKIYVRLHKNTVKDFSMDSNPMITYVDQITGNDLSNSYELSQDQFQLNNGSYSDNFFLNNLAAPIYLDAQGTATITIPSITFPSLSDNITFKVVTENANTGALTTIVPAEFYGPTNLITQAHTINLQVIAGEPVYLRFIVESDSQTNFLPVSWNTKISVTYNASTTYNSNINTVFFAVPEYPSFAVTQLKPKLDIYSVPNSVFFNESHDFGIQINKNIAGNNSLGTGSFYYIIKRGNQVLGKRRIVFSDANNTLNLLEENMISGQPVSGVSPIGFFNGNPTFASLQNDHLITVEVYCKTAGDYDLFNKYSEYFSGNPFVIYLDNTSNYGSTSATAVNTAMYNSRSTLYNNWGQFLYKPGELINYKYGFPIGASDFLTPPAPQNTYQPCLVYQNDPTALANCILNMAPIPTTGLAPDRVAPMKVNIARGAVKKTFVGKWLGSGPLQFSSAGSFNTDENVNYFTDPVTNLPAVTPISYTSGQLSVDTSMKAISRNQKSSSRNTTEGLSVGSVSGGNSETVLTGVGSIETQTFSDMNGDGYPDLVYPQSIQFTNSTGSLEDVQLVNYGFYPTNSLSYMKNNSAGFSYNAFSVGGRIGAHGGNGTTTQASNGLPWSGGASVGASLNQYYNSYDKGEGFWMDINGDGLPDRISAGGSQYINCSLNLGKNLAGSAPVQNLITYSSHPKGGPSISLGTSLGSSANLGALSSFGFGISAGVSASTSIGSADVVYEDINGDGLIDILEVDSNGSTQVRYNLGNKFNTAVPLVKSSGDLNFADETRSFNGSFTFGGNFMFNFGPITLIPPIVVLILWVKAGAGANVNLGLNVSETRKAFKDMNGDGFTDLVQDTNSGFIVNYSQMGRTNKLKSITNTISKGKYLMDYEFARANYSNSHAKLVVNKISIVEPDVFSQNYTKEQGNKIDTNYRFLNRKYDRRERDDFGFETVIKQEMNGASTERVITDFYYNNTYLMNGMIKKNTVQSGNGSYLSEINYEYKLRKFINNTSQIDLNSDLGVDYDMGGSEGRKMATAMLVQKQNKVFESGGDITTTELFKYTTLGLMEQYQYMSPSASYNSNITYQSYGNNIIGVPALIEVYDGNTQSSLLRQRRAENINYYTGDVGSYVIFDGTQDIVTDVEYYATGNVKKVTYPPNNDINGQRYVINYTYDLETEKYVTKVKDNFDIESKANYNPLFDVVIRKVDTGGNAMVFYYDGFGRTRTITGPNEIAANSAVPTVKYNYWTDHAGIPNTDATVKIYRASTANYDPEHAGSNNTINTDAYADFLGRIMQVKKDIQTSNGEARSVSGKTIYDGVGRVIRQYQPTAEALGNQNLITGVSGAPTSSTYNSRDRVISATDEDGNTKDISYAIENNLLKVTEEFLTQKSESFSNAEGKVVMKNDYLNTQPLTTIFKYNTIGELMEVQDPEGISTRYSYNLAGRRMEQRHADKGLTNYEYDPAGNLIKLTTDNLLNDSTINTHFIEYKYDHNRLSEIVLPDLPSGDPNPNNVIYQYGPYTAGNNAGKLVAKADGTGDTGYKYGRMGEVISELRIIRGAHIPEMYFKTYFNYDSWNRITKIKYPDNEIVSYHYDLGGSLKSVDNNNGETYIQNITYDHLEQREAITYGNGTSQYYYYQQQNHRLERYYLYDSSNNLMLNNTYKYDEFSNITKIKNEAYPLANGMGGAYQSYFGYDTLNRLTGTGSDNTILDGEQQPIQNTFIAPTTYQLELEYNNAGGIVQKLQHHERDQNVVHENTYQNKYEYVQNTHKLEKVYDSSTGIAETFEYDFNGNAVNHNDQNGTKKMYWDEQDRLKAFYNDNNGIYQYYTYDDKGERTIKYGLEIPTQLYQNGVPVEINELKLFEFKIYPNPYLTVSSTGQYTKHYFEGSKRFASRLLDGAVRYEDPSVLYTNKTVEDKPASKPADAKADFKKYLEKTELGQNVSIELREVYQSPDLYYLHGDHLGTATFVTNSQSQATQFFLNLPFGETMMEQIDGSYDNPFKFNAKELDDDTGLYYYGARYYNPRLSVWYGVDPLAEKYPTLSPYVYTANNPVKYIDPDGKRIIIWMRRGDGSYKQTEYSYKKNRNYNELSYGYERNAMKLLDKMYEAGVNTDFIDKATSSKKDLNIIKPTLEGRNRYRNMVGLYEGKKNLSEMQHLDPEKSIGTVFWDDETAIDIKDVGGKKGGSLSPAGTGLHEINHAEDAFFNPVAHQTNTAVDKETGEPVVKPPVGFPNQEEYRNTTETNGEAKKMELLDSKRTIYGEGTSRKVNDILKN